MANDIDSDFLRKILSISDSIPKQAHKDIVSRIMLGDVDFIEKILEASIHVTPNSYSVLEDTNELLYFDNFPEKGVFKAHEIKDDLKISEDVLEAMVELNKKSENLFFASIAFITLFGVLSFFILNSE